MSDPRILVEYFHVLDLAEASDVELAEFAQRHAVAVERLERCQEYLRASAPNRVKFELLSPVREPGQHTAPPLVVRVARAHSASVELPTEFPSEHLLALIEILDER